MNQEDKKHWTMEDFGIPHTEGYLRFYLIGFDEYVSEYLGWFDMNDWDKGMQKVWQAAEKSEHRDEQYQLIHHNQLLELSRNVRALMEDALDETNPVIAEYWAKKEKNT